MLGAGKAVERQVVATLCQGGAADVVAGALKAIDREMPDEAQLLAQVHDEVLIERLAGWNADSLAKFVRLCETGHGFELVLPLESDTREVRTWGEKSGGGHGYSGFIGRVRESREVVA